MHTSATCASSPLHPPADVQVSQATVLAQLQQQHLQLLAATHALAAALTSKPQGYVFMRSCPDLLAALARAADPHAFSSADVGAPSASASCPPQQGVLPHSLATQLAAAARAAVAAGVVEQAPMHPDTLPAVLALVGALSEQHSRRAALFALASSPAALRGLLRLLHCGVLPAGAGQAAPPLVGAAVAADAMACLRGQVCTCRA